MVPFEVALGVFLINRSIWPHTKNWDFNQKNKDRGINSVSFTAFKEYGYTEINFAVYYKKFQCYDFWKHLKHGSINQTINSLYEVVINFVTIIWQNKIIIKPRQFGNNRAVRQLQ